MASPLPPFLLLLATLAGCHGGASTGSDLPALPPRRATPTLPAAGNAVPLKVVTLAWTAEVRGEIEVCGCPTVPYGGFARRAAYLDRLRDQGAPVFVFDAGDMLLKGARGAPAPDQALRARTVLTLARDVGLDAWAPAPNDLRAREDMDGADAAWPDAVAVNIPGLSGARVVEHDGARIGVVGIKGAPPGGALEPAGVVRSVAAAIAGAGAADGWVALSNADPATNRAVAEGVPELGMVLATRGDELDPPLRTSGAPILEAPDRGRFVSVVRWAIGAAPGPVTLVNDTPSGRSWESWDDALERLVLQQGAARTAEQGRVDGLWRGPAAQAAGRNLALVRDRPLGSDLGDAPTIATAVASFQRQAVGAAQQRVKQSDTVTYISAGGCTGCHDDYVAAWAATPSHPQAWQALVARGQTGNTECVSCHSTAWGQPGGNASADEVAMRTWKAVQCEACHGPLSAHREDPHANHARPVTEATCTSCHDPANSPQFDYASYRSRLSCVSQKAADGAAR